MKKLTRLALAVSTALFLVPCLLLAQAQQGQQGQDDKETDHGFVDFGVRFATGDVYGRPDLPFNPPVSTSKFNEYRDVRDGFYLRRADIHFDNILGTHNYVSLQAQSAVYRDQSYLATFGEYGHFKVQFRYDEIPHIYSNTTRTLFTELTPGSSPNCGGVSCVQWTFPALIRQSLQAPVAPGNSLPNVINTQLVPQENFITPRILRQGGTLFSNYAVTPHWTFYGMYFRESQRGNRPIGLIMNSSPSASVTAGFGAELPEPIRYYNNLIRAGVDYTRHSLVFDTSYIGSFFQNDLNSMSWDNPFRLTDETAANPLTGRMALYPNNQYNQFNLATGMDLTKYLHFTASITPGWIRQNQAFLPYTTNTAINTCGDGTQPCTSLSVLPENSLHGDVQTLAMNYVLTSNPWKNIQLTANYRHYDYNDNTAVRTFTPVQGDVGAPSPNDNTPFGFNRKDIEVSGNWYFAKRSSFKVGYEGEWMDRSNRDVAHSMENAVFTAADWSPMRDLLFRVSYRHANRQPDRYQDDTVTDPITGAEVTCTDTDVQFTADQRCLRRFDEAARLQDSGDAMVQYNVNDRFTITGFAGTLQNNYNLKGGTNSPTALNFLTGAAATTNPYYLYGVLKDLSWNYGFDLDYSLSSQLTVFAEYSYQFYNYRMVSRNRTPPPAGLTILTCSGCDTANNDWQSTQREPVNIYSAGIDYYPTKKMSISTYYSLSAGNAYVNSRFLGDPTITTGANQFLLTGTNAAVNYPSTVNRTHEVGFLLKYRLTERFTPRFEYRYQQWDNRDYQTTVMTPYMGCVSPPPPSAVVPGCTNPILNSSTSPTPLPGALSPFYPGFVVGDPSAARYLFLGVDQPSYHAHIIMATLEYRF